MQQWQVTCQCGYRANGTEAEVVAEIQEHGRSAHGQELTSAQVMEIAVPA